MKPILSLALILSTAILSAQTQETILHARIHLSDLLGKSPESAKDLEKLKVLQGGK